MLSKFHGVFGIEVCIAICFIISFSISFVVIPPIVRFAQIRNLYDKPNKRKSHNTLVPRLGGVALFLSFVLSATLCFEFSSITGFQYLLAAIVIIFLRA